LLPCSDRRVDPTGARLDQVEQAHLVQDLAHALGIWLFAGRERWSPPCPKQGRVLRYHGEAAPERLSVPGAHVPAVDQDGAALGS